MVAIRSSAKNDRIGQFSRAALFAHHQGPTGEEGLIELYNPLQYMSRTGGTSSENDRDKHSDLSVCEPCSTQLMKKGDLVCEPNRPTPYAARAKIITLRRRFTFLSF